MRKLKTLTLLSTASLILAIPALAGPRADLDNNGTVTKTEFISHSSARFKTADTNFDGFLDSSERKALKDARRQKRNDEKFEKIDANKDGLISKAEMETANQVRGEKKSEHRTKMQAKRKARLDTDQDGVISETERATAKAMRQERQSKSSLGKRKHRVKLDGNSDGLVSLAEYTTHTDILFTRMDANGDGVLTKGEGRKRHKKRRPMKNKPL